ncbi:NADH-ubiquinone oxidoreductase-F iron-sulfur binding region domain-containing protein [Fulvivirga sedimenti]|uniref:NAD(P)H-dependent oxidoreductase subunit E n=1 Tax=Fulvivirga sedimenti TaxID=2879465 RepID=A0A9X1L023_9BACT|nr:NADH-ubiquinone oxidoreductase-F iron-sulfur binding region domain-containing protein [Fulvivirga sedimenti]MCA6074497.1 NAD(P)H-dependent oxidoreductase subunit E [Fulvivirga sedimenti]MCA6075674.1 NAD(P)H-dependent oxidoreductase subunit E [Fulvivirga sedimenti]MCA6076802.1 NAD(P)H-dependent oxidoreductase subunit E [Fulvivirga sedimenti]
MSGNLSHLLSRKPLSNGLLNAQHRASADSGEVSPEQAGTIAADFNVGPANVLGSSSFYDFLKPANKGKKVYVCSGSACMLAGTQPALRQNIEQLVGAAEIGEMCCLGRCHENSAMHYNGINYSGCTTEDVRGILKDELTDGYDTYHVESDLGDSVLMPWMSNMEDFKPLINSILNDHEENLLHEIKLSELRGRGGGGFPMSVKINALLQSDSKVKYIVCNADEGDPGSYSDRYLMEHRPHQVLFGMFLTGYITGAQSGIIYVRAEYPESLRIMQDAAAQWNQLKPDHTNFTFTFEIVKGAGSYVVGEETALLSSIEGQRPEVRVRPPYPVEKGLFGKPTLVNNVETFANLPYIAEHGGEAFSRLGTAKSKGTKLVSLDSHFNRPGVYEVLMGTSLSHVVYTLGQGFRSPVKALHIGGPLGGVVPVNMIDSLTLDFESFREAGFELGHASILAIPESFPMIDYMIHLFEFVAHESCGKCFPCRLGSKRGFELLKASLIGSRINSTEFRDLLEALQYGSLCGLGSGLTTPIRNILRHFHSEIEAYFKND